MHNEYAMALPQQPRTRTRRRTRRGVWFPKLAVILALAVLVPTFWRGLTVGHGPGPGPGPYQPVEIVYQNPELPNGCEVTSLAMVLTSVGCPVDKVTLYRDYLPKADFSYVESQRYGPNPEKWYVGDASREKGGWYCFQWPVVQAADGWLNHCGSELHARSVTGMSKTELDRCALDEVPLVVWVTLDYATPRYSDFFWTLEDGTEYQPYSNLHCVVLAGVQEGQYRIADPITGFVLIDKDKFWNSFSAMGSRAVLVE